MHRKVQSAQRARSPEISTTQKKRVKKKQKISPQAIFPKVEGIFEKYIKRSEIKKERHKRKKRSKRMGQSLIIEYRTPEEERHKQRAATSFRNYKRILPQNFNEESSEESEEESRELIDSIDGFAIRHAKPKEPNILDKLIEEQKEKEYSERISNLKTMGGRESESVNWHNLNKRVSIKLMTDTNIMPHLPFHAQFQFKRQETIKVKKVQPTSLHAILKLASMEELTKMYVNSEGKDVTIPSPIRKSIRHSGFGQNIDVGEEIRMKQRYYEAKKVIKVPTKWSDQQIIVEKILGTELVRTKKESKSIQRSWILNLDKRERIKFAYAPMTLKKLTRDEIILVFEYIIITYF